MACTRGLVDSALLESHLSALWLRAFYEPVPAATCSWLCLDDRRAVDWWAPKCYLATYGDPPLEQVGKIWIMVSHSLISSLIQCSMSLDTYELIWSYWHQTTHSMWIYDIRPLIACGSMTFNPFQSSCFGSYSISNSIATHCSVNRNMRSSYTMRVQLTSSEQVSL